MKDFVMCGLLLAGFVSPDRAMAVPTLYPADFNPTLRNTTNSNILADTDSRLRYFVLPPSDAVAQVSGLHAVTANVGFCREIAKLQKYNADTLDLLNKMKTKDFETKNLLEQQNTKLVHAKEELSKFITAASLQELDALDAKVVQLEKRLDELYLKLKNCRTHDCAALNRDVEDTQLLRNELVTKRFELSAANLMAANEYERKKVFVAGLKNNVEELQNSWRTIQNDLKDLYSEFNRMFDAHAAREGGRVTIKYQSGWTDNVSRLRQLNPGYSFEQIQTKNVNIKAGAYSKNSLIPGGSILAFDVGGQSANAVLSLESYPEGFTGHAVLNLLGVCPLLHPDWFDVGITNSVQDLNYGITIGYEYPAAMKYEVTAHYNMYRMYELIKAQGNDGGFFSTSTWSDHDEEEFFKDAFRVDWKVQDERQQLSFDQKMAVNSDLRRQVLSRMAGEVIMNDRSTNPIAIAELPKPGSLVLANSLDKSCPLNVYCKGASIVMNLLQAVFGSSTTQQGLRQITNIDMTDSYTNSQIVLQPMVTTYK